MPHFENRSCPIPSGTRPVTGAALLSEVAKLQAQARCKCGWVFGKRVARELGLSGYDVGEGTGWGYWNMAQSLEASGDLEICRAKDPRRCPNMKANRNYVRVHGE